MSILNLKSDFKLFKISYLAFFSLLICISIYFILFGYIKPFILCLVIPVLILFSFYFDKYFLYFFVASLFIEYTFPLRLQIVNFVSFAIILFFIFNNDKSIFSQQNLPKIVKFSGILLLSAVLLSSFNSPYFSFESVYYGFGFMIFMFISYITFRYSNNINKISGLLDAFFYGTFIAGVIIIIFIIITGNIRFAGISGYAYFDYTPIALIIAIFSFFIFGKSNNLIKISTLVIFIAMIASLSRNSWIGFSLAFVYGMIITMKFKKNELNIFRNKITIIFISLLLSIFLLSYTGIGSVAMQRLTQVNFQLFSQNETGELLNNSLESRILIWLVAFNAFLHHPWTGVGYFMFYLVSEDYNILPDILYTLFVKGLDAHTTYFNFLCETGIVGLSSFLFYIILILRYSFKAIKLSISDDEKKVSITLHILIFFVFVHSIYAGAFTFGQNAFQMHFLFGLAVANYVNLNKLRNNSISKF